MRDPGRSQLCWGDLSVSRAEDKAGQRGHGKKSGGPLGPGFPSAWAGRGVTSTGARTDLREGPGESGRGPGVKARLCP